MVAGFQEPLIPSFDVTGSAGGTEFWQSGPMVSKVGITFGLTLNTIVFDVAEPLPQGSVKVTTQRTESLLTKLLLVYAGLFVPTFCPSSSHW